jgi:hypothetical protein
MSRRSAARSVAVLASAVSLLPQGAAGEGLKPDPQRLLVRSPVALDITRALRGAIRKLEDPACQQLFEDFTDAQGRTLRENLGPLTPAEYLARLLIHDGEIPKGSGRCASPGAAAFTAGGAAVFVCGRNFRSQKPSRRETALIHEMLHTLGLRENPPSSAEITRKVEGRCGS